MLWIFFCFPLVTRSSMEVLVISLFCILWSFVMLPILLKWTITHCLSRSNCFCESFISCLSSSSMTSPSKSLLPLRISCGWPAWSPFEIFLFKNPYESLRDWPAVWSYRSLFRYLKEAAVNRESVIIRFHYSNSLNKTGIFVIVVVHWLSFVGF